MLRVNNFIQNFEEKMKCTKCKESKGLAEMFGMGRIRASYQGAGKPARKTFEKYETPVTPFKICRFCWPETAECWALKKYDRMSWDYRWEDSRERDFPYTFIQFWEWLKKQPNFKKAAQWKPNANKRGQGRICIDRIDNNIGYELHNLQVITVSENSSKNDSEVFSAFRVAMRFFRKLRKDRKLTKYEMAHELGILPQTYYYLEDKARGCSFEVLCLLHERLGVPWAEIGDLIMSEVKQNTKDNKGLVTQERNDPEADIKKK